MSNERVYIVAHRGFSGAYPENTARAFTEARRLGVEMIEFDVRLTRDGAAVVVHDQTVDRTTDGTGRVAEMTLGELQELDAGRWMEPGFEGERVPSLAQAVEAIPAPTRLNVHLKSDAVDVERLIRSALADLKAFNVLDRTLVTSEDHVISEVKTAEPELEVCSLSREPLETYIARSDAAGCRVLQPINETVDAAFVREAHRRQMWVQPFYADQENEMIRLLKCGVDGILTNWPDTLKAVIERFG